MHAQVSDRRVGMKRRAAGEHFVHHHAQRINIGARVEFIAPHAGSLLERHICGRAEHHAGLRVHAGFAQLGNAEIDELDHNGS